MRPLARIGAAGVGVALALVALMPALAQPPYPIYDRCLSIEHFPDEPIDGAPSRFGLYASVGTRFGGGMLNFTYSGASGDQMGSGPIDANGIGHGYGPLFSYGPHRLERAYVMMEGQMFDLELTDPDFEVGDPEPTCNAENLTVVETAESTDTTTEATTTTTEATTTTTEATTSTTDGSETTTAIAEETPPTSIEIIDSGGTSYVAWWWVGGLLFVIGGGLFFFARADETDCIPLKAAWLRAKKACDEAREQAKKREEMLQKARDGLEDSQKERKKWEDLVEEIEAELSQLESARGTSVTYGDTTFHRIPEGLVTSDGLESIIDAVTDRLNNARNNVPDTTASEREWQKRVAEQEAAVKEAHERADALCAEAEAAKKAYEDCIKAPAGDDAGDSGGDGADGTGEDGGDAGTSTGGTPGVAGGESGGGTTPTPPPTPPSSAPDEPTDPGCTNGTRRNEGIVDDQTFRVPKMSSNLILVIEPGVEDFAEWMAGELAKGGGRFAPNKLLDPAFSSEVTRHLRELDNDLSVAHEIRVEVPQQEVRYICVEWEECVNGAWVDRREKRRSTSRDLPNRVFERSGKIGTRDVQQLLAQAVAHLNTLIRNDQRIDSFCP